MKLTAATRYQSATWLALICVPCPASWLFLGGGPRLLLLEHLQHAPGDEKAAEGIDRHHGAVLADQRRLDDLVVLRHRELSGLGIERQREEVDHVARIERRRVGCYSRRQVAEADNLHAVADHDLVELRALDVAALLDREIDDDRAGLHRR